MRLKNLTIKAFRGFLDACEFCLDADVILLAGSNGLGKSTFFDAFEWCLTGQLKRYELSKIEKKQHPYIVNRFANGAAFVKACFIDGENTIEFTREGNEKRTTLSIKVNHTEIPQREVKEKQLEILISDEELLGQIRQKDLEYLLLRSHLLEQELTSEFLRSVSPTNRFSQLSKILGADRFESFYKKLSGSYRFIDEELVVQEKKFANVNSDLEKKKSELDKERELLKTLPGKKSKADVYDQCLEPLQRLRQYLPDVPQITEEWLTFETDEFCDLMKRYCRSQLEKAETLLEKVVSEKSALYNIHEEFKDIDSITESEKKYRTELEKHKKRKIELEKEKAEPTRKLRAAEKEEAKIGKTLISLRAKGKILRSLQERADEYHAKKKEKNNLSTELSNIQKALDVKLNTLNSLMKAYETKRASVENSERQRTTLATEVEKWEFLKKKRLELGNLRKQIQRLQHGLTKDRQTLNEEIDAISKVQIKIQQKEKEKTEMLRKSAELNEIVSERSQLLGTLKAHIEGGTCPLCGHNWKSAEVLLEQVQRMSGRDEKLIAQQKTELLHVEKELSNLLRESSERQANAETVKNKVNAAASELRQLQENEEEVKKAASEYGVSAEKFLSMEKQYVEKSLIQAKNNLNELDVKLAILTKEVTQDFQTVSALESEMNKMKIERETKKKRIQDLSVSLLEFEREAAEIGITEGELSEIGKYVALTEKEIRELSQKREKAMEEKKGALIKIEKIDKGEDQQTEKYEALYRVLEHHQEQIRIFLSKIRRLGLGSYREVSEKLAALAESEQDISRLIEDLTKTLELIDSVRARIRYENLKKEVQELKGKVRGLRREIERIKASRNLAKKLNRAARKETRTVIETLIKAHEPLINEFYRQINPHPRFTTINFVPKGVPGRGGGNAIFIEATDEYEKKVVNPSLTFSSAQLNVLAISIFLAIHTNQAWSKLDTILMDDPVQNMDDLNILSYIDLIRKIRKKKQIIISTHDDNIFRLMRRKLQPSDKGQLICYEYKSFNVNGPEIIIDRISAAE